MVYRLIEFEEVAGAIDVEDDSNLTAVAELLESQWPSAATDKYHALRRRKRRVLAGTNSTSGSKACSFGLYHSKRQEIVGFFRLQKAVNVPWENSCAIVSVVIQSALRGQGIGKKMMKLAEETARERGYLYMYLWTNDAQHFYEKCGFETCSSISLSSPVLDLLAKNSHDSDSGGVATDTNDEEASAGLKFLSNLEAALMNRRKQEQKKRLYVLDNAVDVDATEPSQMKTAASDDGDEEINEDTTWMRKRLVLEVPSVPRSTVETCFAIEKSLIQKLKAHKNVSEVSYYLRFVPWKQQVGPSCGMTALLGAQEFLLGNTVSPNILEEAKKRGISHEGELFNIKGTHILASEVLGLSSNIIHLDSVSIARLLLNGSLIIFPYDPEAGTYEPVCLQGIKAHYCTIIGFALLSLDNHSSDSVSVTHMESSEDAMQLLEHSLPSLESSPENIMLIAQHSLKSSLVIAPAKEFFLSNAQLVKAKEGLHNVSRWITDNLDLRCKCLQVSANPR